MKIPDKVLNWLLDEDEPAIAYRTRIELLDEPEIPNLKVRVLDSKHVKNIFEKMHPDGYWYYVDKRINRGLGDGVAYLDCVTTHFNLSYLSEMGLSKNDPNINKAVERYLSLQKDDGDFLAHYSCLYAYNLRTFIRFGYVDDPRTKKTVNLLLKSIRFDGGYLCDPHTRTEKVKKSCIRGSVKALMAFSSLPELWKSDGCKQLTDYFLRRDCVFKSDKSEYVNGEIATTIFPFIWRCSFLEILYALSKMGYGNRTELEKTWLLLDKKRNNDGKYILDWTPNRSYFKAGKRGEVNKWITLYAYLALKYKDKRQKK